MTQLPDSLDSDPIKSGKDKPAYNDEDLICEFSQIFDQSKVNDFFNSKVGERGKLVSLLKDLKSKGFDRISLELGKNPLKARKAISSYAFLTDCLVNSAWEFATEIQFPSHNPTEAEKLSIISVGGYGTVSYTHLTLPTKA